LGETSRTLHHYRKKKNTVSLRRRRTGKMSSSASAGEITLVLLLYDLGGKCQLAARGKKKAKRGSAPHYPMCQCLSHRKRRKKNYFEREKSDTNPQERGGNSKKRKGLNPQERGLARIEGTQFNPWFSGEEQERRP